MNLKTGKVILISLFAMGIICFAAYGIGNAVKANGNIVGQNADGRTIVINQTPDISPDGALCPLGGCSVCSGCVSLEYQAIVDTKPSVSTDSSPY